MAALLRRNLILLSAALLLPAPAFATEATILEIRPGPAAISEEERAIVADPNRGIDQAVILIDETDRNEASRRSNMGLQRWTTYQHHLRAKILSNEARDLADVTIPFNRQEGTLRAWWGKVILPDGTVRELKEGELVEQTEARTSAESFRVLKGTLPGVTPGCVIDYGYAFVWNRYQAQGSVSLQRRWPIREFRYRWVPPGVVTSGYDLIRTEGLEIDLLRGGRVVLIKGRNLPPLFPEPWMPPWEEVGAKFAYSTTLEAVDPVTFWKRASEQIEKRIAAFSGGGDAIRTAIASMNLPPEADVSEKLRLAHGWIQANIRNESLGHGEDFDWDEEEDANQYGLDFKRETPPNARDVLEKREGADHEIDFLFIAIARALGARAHLVLATDRRERYWRESHLEMDQFGWSLVGVWVPGRPEEQETVTDPGSWLPYGEIPWWVTGVQGFMAVGGKPRPIALKPSNARRNVSESKVEISFDPAGEILRVKWSRDGSGQQGYMERWALRGLALDERPSRITRFCAAGSAFDIREADARGIDDPNVPFGLDCEAEFQQSLPAGGGGALFIDIAGPWLPEVPLFSAPTRAHPIIFPFPRTDLASLEVAAPPGFAPVEGTPPVFIEGPYGRYVLSVTATPSGYHVERVFVLAPLGVPPPEYEALRAFLTDVIRADRTRLEFRRSGGTP